MMTYKYGFYFKPRLVIKTKQNIKSPLRGQQALKYLPKHKIELLRIVLKNMETAKPFCLLEKKTHRWRGFARCLRARGGECFWTRHVFLIP